MLSDDEDDDIDQSGSSGEEDVDDVDTEEKGNNQVPTTKAATTVVTTTTKKVSTIFNNSTKTTVSKIKSSDKTESSVGSAGNEGLISGNRTEIEEHSIVEDISENSKSDNSDSENAVSENAVSEDTSSENSIPEITISKITSPEITIPELTNAENDETSNNKETVIKDLKNFMKTSTLQNIMTRGQFMREFLQPLPEIHSDIDPAVFADYEFKPTKSKVGVDPPTETELRKYGLMPDYFEMDQDPSDLYDEFQPSLVENMASEKASPEEVVILPEFEKAKNISSPHVPDMRVVGPEESVLVKERVSSGDGGDSDDERDESKYDYSPYYYSNETSSTPDYPEYPTLAITNFSIPTSTGQESQTTQNQIIVPEIESDAELKNELNNEPKLSTNNNILENKIENMPENVPEIKLDFVPEIKLENVDKTENESNDRSENISENIPAKTSKLVFTNETSIIHATETNFTLTTTKPEEITNLTSVLTTTEAIKLTVIIWPKIHEDLPKIFH